MMTMYHDPSISDVTALVRERRLSPVELVRQCLQRIEELNPTINAFITVLEEEALEAAKRAEAEIEAGNWRGPLHGIPVAAKDFYDTAGIRTTAAFAPFQDRVPSRDGLDVARRFEVETNVSMGSRSARSSR